MARRVSTTTTNPLDQLQLGTPETPQTAQVGGLGGPSQVFQPSDVLGAEKEKVVSYLVSEIIDVRDGSDRKALEKNWDNWRRIRLAIPETERRSTPWIDAANVVPPLTMQKVQTIFAKLIAAFSVKKPPVSVQALNVDDADTAMALEKWFKGMAENRYGLDVRRKFKQIAYDLVSLGTQVVKVPFKVESWAFKRSVNGATEEVRYIRHQGPEIVPIQLEDFFTRPYWKDPQRAPWIAIRYRYFYHELKQMEGQGIFVDVDKILGEAITTYDVNTQAELRRQGIEVGNLAGEQPNQQFEVYQAYVFWDLDGDGIPEDLIVWVEPNSGTMLRAEYNPLSVRDVEVMTYLDNPISLYGIGICQMVEGPQAVLTSLQRMRLDGTQLNMLKMFVARRGCGIGPNEEFTPFKLLIVDDPTTDFRPIDFPDISQGVLMGEQMAKEDADRVTGANDYMAGFNDKIVGSNATSSGIQYLSNQANSQLNSLLENVEMGMTNVYMYALYQCIANKDLVDLSWLPPSDQTAIRSVLELKVEDLPTKFRFQVRTTDINRTDESRKQNYMMAMQLYNQYFQAAMSILQMKMNPQIGQNPDMQELLTSTYVGMTSLTERMLEFFDIGDPQDFLPFIEQLKVQMRAADKVRAEQAQAMKEVLNGQGGTFGGNGIQGAMPTGGLGGLPTGPGQAPGNPGIPPIGGAPGPGGTLPTGGPNPIG